MLDTKGLKEEISSSCVNVVDYLVISRDIETFSWDKHPVKTALCYRALSGTGQIKNLEETEIWLKNWLDEQIPSFDPSDRQQSRQIRMYVEGAAESIFALEESRINKSEVQEFFEETVISEGSNKGSWENDVIITSKVLAAYDKLNLEIPRESLGWLKQKVNTRDLGIEELTTISYYVDLGDSNKEVERQIKNEFERKENYSIDELSSYILSRTSEIDEEQLGLLKDKVDQEGSIRINAGLTKALWQATMLKSTSFTNEEVSDKLKELSNDRYWVDYIQDIDQSNIVLDLENEEEFLSGNRNITSLARAIMVLSEKDALKAVEVTERHLEDLKDLENSFNKREFLSKPIAIGRNTSIGLGLISGVSAYAILSILGLGQVEFQGYPVGEAASLLIMSLFILTGFTGSVSYSLRRTYQSVKKMATRVDDAKPVDLSK